MEEIWNQVEQVWPAPAGETSLGYEACRHGANQLLLNCSIVTVAFSHFGVVVHSINDALSALHEFSETPLPHTTAVWIEAYQVQVARLAVGSTELEFIAPGSEGFFAEHQRAFGDGLHHVSFQVQDVSAALRRLSAHGIRLIDREPRLGSHGGVAFTAPEVVSPVCLEVFQAQPGSHASRT